MTSGWDWQRYLQAATGYCELGMFDAALQELKEIPAEYRDELSVVSFRLGLAMAMKSWSLAAELAGYLVQTQPEESGWWINLAYSTRRAISLDEAEAILLRAVAIHPQEALIHFNLACYASVSGHLQLARERLERAVSLTPSIRQMALEDEDLSPLKDIIPTL